MNYLEIKSELKRIFDDADSIDIVKHDWGFDITFTSMYEAPKLHYARLKAVAELFGTDEIDDLHRFYESGCETCDYGSSAGFTLIVRNPTKWFT